MLRPQISVLQLERSKDIKKKNLILITISIKKIYINIQY